MKTYDAIMIGFGKGSKTLAADMAKQGYHVAMIEQSDEMYGGTCINEGCIPSKSLITQAGSQPYFDAIQQKETLIKKLRQKNYENLDKLENVTIYHAFAEFVHAHEVHIKSDTIDEIIYGTKIFINTGSIPNIPNMEGLPTTSHIYTSAQLMKLEQLPKRLAIIGGGYIGLEFASMYSRYGSKVTVLERGTRLVKREDLEVADEIQKVLQQQGVSFEFSSQVQSFQNEGDTVVITYQNQTGKQILKVDGVLLATGRHANTSALQLEKAGVKTDERGNILVNEHLQTNVPHIYAMGDVKGGQQFTYISLDDYRIVKDHIFYDGKRTINNRGHIAYSVFISPTFSRVGLSEEEARNAGYDVKVTKRLASTIPRASIISQPNGILKAVIDSKTDQILGCVLFCAESEEMINFITLAMNQKLPYQVIRDHIFTHPTMSEALNELFNI